MLILFSLLISSLSGQTSVSLKRVYDTTAVRPGLLILSKDGIKIADAVPGFSYINGGDQASLLTQFCSSNHSISEVPTQDSAGRFLLRIRPNPATIAVYRGGIRLEPEVHYRLVYLEDGKLPDRFELTAAAPPAGKVIVDYTVGFIPLN